jgi:hypothetical protein
MGGGWTLELDIKSYFDLTSAKSPGTGQRAHRTIERERDRSSFAAVASVAC